MGLNKGMELVRASVHGEVLLLFPFFHLCVIDYAAVLEHGRSYNSVYIYSSCDRSDLVWYRRWADDVSEFSRGKKRRGDNVASLASGVVMCARSMIFPRKQVVVVVSMQRNATQCMNIANSHTRALNCLASTWKRRKAACYFNSVKKQARQAGIFPCR